MGFASEIVKGGGEMEVRRPEGHHYLVNLIPLHTAHWPVKARGEGGIRQGGRGG